VGVADRSARTSLAYISRVPRQRRVTQCSERRVTLCSKRRVAQCSEGNVSDLTEVYYQFPSTMLYLASRNFERACSRPSERERESERERKRSLPTNGWRSLTLLGAGLRRVEVTPALFEPRDQRRLFQVCPLVHFGSVVCTEIQSSPSHA
jgi:hypothetical protein